MPMLHALVKFSSLGHVALLDLRRATCGRIKVTASVIDPKLVHAVVNSFYPVRICAAGLSVWFRLYVCIFMCIIICVYVWCDQKTSVLYLASHNSSQKRV